MARRKLDIAVHLIAGPSRLPFRPLAPLSLRSHTPSSGPRRSLHLVPQTQDRQHLPLPPSCTRPLSYRRLNSTSSHPPKRAQQNAEPVDKLTAEEQRAYGRLRPIIDALPGPVDWAVAYGSGVRHQANADPSGVSPLSSPSSTAEGDADSQKPPMTDFLLSTPSLTDFHTANLKQNPSHYPLTARLLGGRRIAWLTDRWGAGVWYVTMVRIRDLEVKYGVISTERLKRDLEGWETLYVAGRLHKPVLPLLTPPPLQPALHTNLRSALALSLLLLPPTFTELSLWTQIAGISYAGDPRMSVPGAEHPDKIANIVRGKGALEGMRGLYGGFLGGEGGFYVRWDEGEGGVEEGMEEGMEAAEKLVWKGTGAELLRCPIELISRQPDSPEHRASLIMSLPPTLRTSFRAHFNPSSVASATNAFEERIKTARAAERAQFSISGKARSSSASRDDRREFLLSEVANIIRRPATTQSLKGLFTAGFRKSFVYALAKFKKWLNARSSASKKSS